MKFRKKPIVIEAMQYFDNELIETDPFWDWMTEDCDYSDPEGSIYDLRIITLEGELHVSDGDWIIKGVAGEFYPCKPDIFEATYEAVDEKAG